MGLPEQTAEEQEENYRKLCREMAENGLRKYQTRRAYLDRKTTA